MWFKWLTIFFLLLCFCWAFRPVFGFILKSIKKVKNDYKQTK